MTTEAIVRITTADADALAEATPRAIVREVVGIIGTATDAASLLTENQPYRIDAAVAKSPPSQTDAEAIAAFNWNGAYGTAKEDGLTTDAARSAARVTDSLDYAVRDVVNNSDANAVVVRVPNNTGGAPPTESVMQTGIQALLRSQAVTGLKPTVLIAPYFGYARATASPWAALPTAVSAGGWVETLSNTADELDGIGVIGAPSNLTRAQLQTWLANNKGNKIVAATPATGVDAGAYRDTAPSYAISMLAQEAANGGRGANLNMMPALGITGQQPPLTQSYTRDDDDVSELVDDGGFVLFYHNGWRWRGATFNASGVGDTPTATQLVNTQRIIDEITQILTDVAILAAARNITARFFPFVTQRVNAALNLMIANGRLAAGVCRPHPTAPVVNNTQAEFVIDIRTFAPATSVSFARRVQLGLAA